jgi:hypothetical protein
MALVDYDRYGSGVTSIPDFEEASRFSGDGLRGENLQLVDIPTPSQTSAAGATLASSDPTVSIPGIDADSDGCVQQRVDAVHAEDPDALIRADMLEEFEQDCK